MSEKSTSPTPIIGTTTMIVKKTSRRLRKLTQSPRSSISPRACSDFSSSSMPSLRFTPGVRSNWISEYSTTSIRFPHGS